MYKTIWLLRNNAQEIKVTYYHFGNYPHLPRFIWGLNMEAEWLCTLPCKTIKSFWKCLTHDFEILSIKERKED